MIVKLSICYISVLILLLSVPSRSDVNDPKQNLAVFRSMLDSISSEAISRNPNLKSTEEKIAASKANIGSIGYDAPLAAVEFYQAPVKSFPNPFKDQMEIDYALQQMIPFPGKLNGMKDVEKKRVTMNSAELKTTKQDILRSVKVSFYELYLADRQLEINANNQKLVRNFIDIARKQYELGMGKLTDILRAQTELSKLMSDSISLTQNRQSVTAMINTLRNVSVNTAINTIPEILPDSIIIPPLDSLLSEANKSRPELESMQSNIAMQSAEVSVAKNEYYPDFMVRGVYKQMINQPDDWSLMLGVTVPIAPWTSNKYSSAIKRSTALVEQAKADYHTTKNMIALQVIDAQTKCLSSQAQIELIINTTIPQARQTLNSAIAGYQTGKQDFLMLLDTQRLLLMAQQDYHIAVMNLLTNYANLQWASGMLTNESISKGVNK